jgi:nicotinamide riboside kinase
VLAPKGVFVDDGTRWMGHSSMESRNKLFNILIGLLNEFGYEYEILNYGYYENYLKVKNYVEGVLNNE